jgi:hypothetical protein
MVPGFRGDSTTSHVSQKSVQVGKTSKSANLRLSEALAVPIFFTYNDVHEQRLNLC